LVILPQSNVNSLSHAPPQDASVHQSQSHYQSHPQPAYPNPAYSAPPAYAPTVAVLPPSQAQGSNSSGAPQSAPVPLHPGSAVIITSSPQFVSGLCVDQQGHYFNEEFTGCGVCLAIAFFPLGIACCWALRENRCKKCGVQLY
jgi:hypothetical protein